MSNLKTQLKHNYEQLLLKKKKQKKKSKKKKKQKNLPSNEEHLPEKGLWKAGREWKCVFHHNFFFFKPKQFTEAIPSMKKAHNEDVQRLGEIKN